MEFIENSKTNVQLFISLVIIFIIITAIYSFWFNCLQNLKIPGPEAIPLLGNLHKFIGSSSATVDYFLLMTRKYYPTCRFWFGSRLFVAISDATDLEIVMNNSSCLHREKLRQAFQATCMEDGLFAISGRTWYKHRKVMNPTFNFQVLNSFLPNFHKKSLQLVDNLQMLANGEPFDALPIITFCTFDIVCETVLGTPMHTQVTKDNTFIQSIYDINITITEITKKPWLQYNWIFNLTKQSSTASKARDVINNLIDKIIKCKTQSLRNVEAMEDIEDCQRRRTAFLESMIHSSINGSSQLSLKEIRSEAVTLMLAGLETTAGTISFCLVLLGIYQDIQEKIYEELTHVFGNSFDEAPSYQQLQEMKYTGQVINEILRMYPVVPVVPRIVEKHTVIQNYVLPAGCTVLLNIYAAHRNPKYFKNPDTFDPENFSEENSCGRHRYAFIPFSGGPRMCIGRKFALLQMKTILATLLRSYRVLPAGSEADLQKLDYQVTLRPINGFTVRLAPRATAK